MNEYHCLAENTGSTTVAGSICPAGALSKKLYVHFGEGHHPKSFVSSCLLSRKNVHWMSCSFSLISHYACTVVAIFFCI